MGGIEPLKRIWPGYVAMVPSTALCFLFLGIGLLVFHRMVAASAMAPGLALSGAAAAFALINFGLSWGSTTSGLGELALPIWIDGDAMAFGTEVEVFISAYCLAALFSRHFWNARAYVASATTGLILAGVAIVGYLFGSSDLYQVFIFDAMALHTAICFVLLHSAFLLAQPGEGWVAVLLGRGSGSSRARRLFLAAIAAPIALCYLTLVLSNAGIMSTSLRLALLAIVVACLAAVTLLVYARGENRAEYFAHFDSLTGLANRQYFNEHLQEAVNYAKTDGDAGLILIDLDHFKQVNDTKGHVVGDKLLIAVAARIQAQMSPGDTAARIGGDEFAAILSGRASHERIRCEAEDLLREIQEPLEIEGIRFMPSVSLGVAVFPRDAQTSEELVVRADLALYAAKARGRSTVHVYTKAEDTPGTYLDVDAQMIGRPHIEHKLEPTPLTSCPS